MSNNLDKQQKLRNPEFLNEGMQVLRQYIHFCHFNFYESCKTYDQNNDGTIQDKFLREALMNISNKSGIYFTDENIMQIIKEAPINPNKGISYKELNQFLQNGPIPLNCFFIYKNAVLKQTQSQIIRAKLKQYLQDIQTQFQEETSSFFDRKVTFDFKHFHLHKLDVELLSEQKQYIYFDTNIQEKVAQLSELNNEIILDNFQISIAKKLSVLALPQLAQMFIMPEKIEVALIEYLGSSKRQNIFPLILKEQFQTLIKQKLTSQPMTNDEINLLYYLIWKRDKFLQFNLKSFVKWIIEMRSRKLRDMIQLYDPQSQEEQQLKLPKIFTALKTIADKYSPQILLESFNLFSEKKGYANLEELRIVLRNLEIGYNQEEFTELRLFLAGRGLFSIGDKSELLVKYEQLVKEISPLGQNEQETQVTDTENAYSAFFKSMVLSVLEKLEGKAVKCMEADLYIDEFQLRTIIADDLPKIDHVALSKIILSLQNVKQPTKEKPVRQIYFPELVDNMKQRFIVEMKLPEQPKKENKLDLSDEHEEIKEFKVQGRFLEEPTQAFSVQILDDRVVLEKFRIELEKHFDIHGETQYERIEKACNGLCMHLKNYDPSRSGLISKDALYSILKDMLKFPPQQIFQLVDFALGAAKVDEQYISYMFFCVQLNQYYQTSQLLSQMKL